eukprot:2160332-Rhodomonas_salina.4
MSQRQPLQVSARGELKLPTTPRPIPSRRIQLSWAIVGGTIDFATVMSRAETRAPVNTDVGGHASSGRRGRVTSPAAARAIGLPGHSTRSPGAFTGGGMQGHISCTRQSTLRFAS